MGSSNYDKLVGKGVAGLGQNELKRRVKQHEALVSKAKDKVGLENDIELMKDIGANKYVFPRDSKPKTSSSEDKTFLGGTKDDWSKAWDMTIRGYKNTGKKWAKNIAKGYKVLDAINYGLLPGGVKPVNPFGSKAGNTLTRLNSSPNIPVWEDRNKKNKNTKL